MPSPTKLWARKVVQRSQNLARGWNNNIIDDPNFGTF